MKRNAVFLMTTLLVALMVSFTSCLNSDSSDPTYEAYVTVNQSMGAVTLKGDNGLTYVPNNPDALVYTEDVGYAEKGDYAKRVYIYYKLVDGEEITEGKTSYKINILGVSELVGKKFADPDTITNKPGVPINEIISKSCWSTNGYINVYFSAYNYNTRPGMFDLYTESVDGTTMYARLNQNQSVENYYNLQTSHALISFELPFKSDLIGYDGIQYINNDSLDVVITAIGRNEELIESTPLRVRINNY